MSSFPEGALREEELDAETEQLAGIRGRRRAMILGSFLLVGVVVAGMAWLFLAASGDGRDRGSSWFQSVAELWSWDSSGTGGAPSLAAADDEARQGSLGRAALEVASISPAQPLVAEGQRLEGGAADFSRLSRQVRQVREPGGATGERALVRAPRDRAEVRLRIQAAAPAIQRCYERRMLTSGNLRGRLLVDFTASSNGTISSIAVRSAMIEDQDLLLCVRAQLSSVRLGRGSVERFSIPIRLVPREGP